MKIQLKRSNVLQSGAAKEPTASQLEYGELAINYNNSDPAIFLKDSNNNIIRISGVGNIADDGLTNVPDGTTPPTNPAPEAGNLWYNSDEGRLYIYYVDGNTSQWVDASPDSWDPTVMPVTTNPAAQSGTLDDRYVMENGDTMTGALLLDNAASASAPDLSFDGDANTGIYSPGADQVAISTNGTSRLFVDASGNVGVGTTPGRIFHVDSGAVNNSYVRFTNDNSTGNGAEVGLFDSGAVGPALVLNNSMSDGVIVLNTNSTERMRIDSSGNVGIGTTSPNRALEINGSNNSTNFEVSDASGGAGFTIYNNTTSNEAALGTTSTSTELSFAIGGFEKARINSSGNVGIGTSSPSDMLTVGPQYDRLRVDPGSGSYDGDGTSVVIDGRTNDGNVTAFKIDRYDGSGSASTKFLINYAGQVGIGTTSPARKLHVHETGSGGCQQRFTNVTTGEGSGDGFEVGINSGEAAQIWNYENTDMLFGTNSSERMRIDSSGRLLVGTSSSPSAGAGQYAKLMSVGNTLSSTGDGRLALARGNTAANLSNGNAIGELLYTDNTGGTFASIGANADAAPGTGDYPGRLVFSTTADGASSPTERMRIDSSGRLLLNSGTDVRIELGTTGTTGTNNRNHLRGDGTSLKYNSCAGGGHIFEANGGERMRISSTGNLGVGITSPTNILDVNGSPRFRGEYIQIGGFKKHVFTGYVAGNSTVSHNITMSASETTHLVICGFNHFGLLNYGCTLMQFVALTPNLTTSSVHSTSTSLGGSWSVSKPSNNNLTVSKSAGTYVGGGHYFVIIFSAA